MAPRFYNSKNGGKNRCRTFNLYAIKKKNNFSLENTQINRTRLATLQSQQSPATFLKRSVQIKKIPEVSLDQKYKNKNSGISTDYI